MERSRLMPHTVRRRALGALALVMLAAAAVAGQTETTVQKGAQLTILQINDVYELTAVDGLGGLARVATLKQTVARAGATPLVLIAGDFLSSSVASTVFKGKQMIDGFNVMGLDIATLGNHEFDFGRDVLLQRMAESKFQYVIANVVDEATGRPPGGAAAHVVRTFNGLKVGFFGLCLSGAGSAADKRQGLRFLEPIPAAGDAVRALVSENVDAIVAITHLTYEEDRELAERFPEISVIVGGHEHFPITSVVNRTLISKAGSDAKYVARIDLRRTSGWIERHIAAIRIDSTIADDPATAAVVARYESQLSAELDGVVGATAVPLDAESRKVRSGEAALGNLLADAMRAESGAQIAILNSGSIRGDRVFAAGPLSRKMLLSIQPFGNVLCTIEVPGRVVVDALNHGFAKLPASDGQFPQVSGLTVDVDAAAPPGSRVRDVRVGGQPLDPARIYTLAIPDFLLDGGDGYALFAGQRVVVGPESGTLIVNALEKYVAGHGSVSPAVEGRIRVAP
jgi:5'-nucleotidase